MYQPPSYGGREHLNKNNNNKTNNKKVFPILYFSGKGVDVSAPESYNLLKGGMFLVNVTRKKGHGLLKVSFL